MIIAPWGLTVKPGTMYKYEIPPFANLKISNAALGAELEDDHSRTTLTIETSDRPPVDSEEDEEPDEDEDKPQLTSIVLTSLTPGKIEQSIHDITFSFPALLKIKATGKNTIHLGGNLVAEPETDESDSEDGYLNYEGAGGLDELSSDVDAIALDASSDGDRFEEILDTLQAKAGQKRPREDDMDDDEDEDEDEDKDEAKQVVLTKSKKKKVSKKLKAQNGEPVPVGAPSTDKKEEKAKAKEKGPESSPEAAKKESKEKKKEHKKNEKEKKKEVKKEKKPEPTNGAPTASANAGSPSNKKTLAGGLVIEDAKVGSGKTAKAGSFCSMRYIGRLTNGTVFDSNTKSKPFTFKLGSGQVIKGWDQGITGMQEGGERILTVPPALAYGNKKSGSIPPSSTLQFEVKLLSIK